MRHDFKPNERVAITMEEPGIAQVRMIRADKMNALDLARFAALLDAGQALFDMPGLRCVVLSGEGRSFCAGLDLTSMGNPERHRERPLTERSHGNSNAPQQAAMQWRKLPVPVIAAVHGVCFGGGLPIASGAAGGDGDEVGAGPRHGRLRVVARGGARRCAARTDLHKP